MRTEKVGKEKAVDFQPTGCSSHGKRQRVEGCEPSGPQHDQKTTLTTDKDDSSTERVLFNSIILQKVFVHFGTRDLFTTCSLVNKAWNAAARTFVRTYRKCTAKTNSNTTACEFLRSLDILCGQMKQSGRVVPFNSLQINFSKGCQDQAASDDEILYSNVISELKIKGLSITSSVSGGSGYPDCVHHKPLLTVLKHKSGELRSLKVDRTGPFSRFTTDKWCPQFHQLEELNIETFHSSHTEKVDTFRLSWLLQDAPNLKRLVARNLDRLPYVPKEILARVAYHGRLTIIDKLNAGQLNLLCAIAEKATGLTELKFYELPLKPFEGKKGEKYKSALEGMLQAAQKSLKTFKTDSAYLPSQMSYPPLLNLSYLGLALRHKQDWNDIASIDFQQNMPTLKKVGLRIESKVDCEGLLYRSTTVRELKLKLKNCDFDLRILCVMFPNVSMLNLHLKDNWPHPRRNGEREWHRAPVWEVFRYWPQQLEELKIKGSARCINRNYDEEFCGLIWDEVGWLREQDEDYLKRIHHVPRRPCLLTMPKLRDFQFLPKAISRYDRWGTEHTEGYTSRLAQILVFNRWPQMNACVPPVTQPKPSKFPPIPISEEYNFYHY